MTYILGLNAYHGDSSASLVRDGVLVAAAEEERFRRIKHWAGFPSEAVRYCLQEAGIGLADLDVVAINQDAGANLWKKVAYLATRRPDLSLVLDPPFAGHLLPGADPVPGLSQLRGRVQGHGPRALRGAALHR